MANLGAIVNMYLPFPTGRFLTMSVDTYNEGARWRDHIMTVIFDIDAARPTIQNHALIPHHLRVTDQRKATYLSDQKQVRGYCRTNLGAPIARLVVVMNGQGSVCGKGMSDPSTGYFKINLDNNQDDPVACIQITLPGDNRNAVVKWRVVPVTAT